MASMHSALASCLPFCANGVDLVAGGHSLNLHQGPGPRDSRHPQRIRDGQVFAPLHGRHHLRAVIRRIEGEWAQVVFEDGSERRLALDRLLAVDHAGRGVHYRFCGWRPRRRGYRAELRVLRVLPKASRCIVSLPEWDPEAEVDQPLAALPEQLRNPGAIGSCLANLASASVAGLNVHSIRAARFHDKSRERLGAHPSVLATGQRYRRRSDGAAFRLLEETSAGAKAWNGNRVVVLRRDRLLATRHDGAGRYFEYIGGGIRKGRRRRAENGSAKR